MQNHIEIESVKFAYALRINAGIYIMYVYLYDICVCMCVCLLKCLQLPWLEFSYWLLCHRCEMLIQTH